MSTRRTRRIGVDDVATAGERKSTNATWAAGPFDTSDANVAEIAELLKASPAEVRKVMRQAAQERAAAMFTGLTGQPAPDDNSPRSLLQAIFGKGPRGGAVNAAAAAKALKVTPNTVRRWAAGTQKPAPDRMKKIRSAARRLTTSKAGRRKTTAAHRKRRPKPPPGGFDTVWVTGWQGPTDEYSSDRHRTVKMDITADQIDELLDKYEQEGDPGLHEWLTEHYSKTVSDWAFHTIDAFGFGDPNYD